MGLGTECRLYSPNGMVERFNDRVTEAVKQTRFVSVAELDMAIECYVKTYNQQISQRALKHLSPIHALKEWQRKKLKFAKSAFITSQDLKNRS